MPRPIRSAIQTARRLRSGLRIAPVLALSLGLAACQSQFQQPSDLLFAPTFSKSRQNIPNTYNTPYDCRTFTGTGWKGIAGGVVYDFDRRDLISQAGCFKTESECQAWLAVMRGYIDVPRFIRCNPYTA